MLNAVSERKRERPSSAIERERAGVSVEGWGRGRFDERVAEDDAADTTESVDSDVDRSLSGRPASIPAVHGKRYERMREEVTRRGQQRARENAGDAASSGRDAARTL